MKLTFLRNDKRILRISSVYWLEDAIITGRVTCKEKANGNTSRFVINILKSRISILESELKSKDAIIEYLTMQLLSSDLNISLMKSSEYHSHETLNDKSIYHNKYEFKELYPSKL